MNANFPVAYRVTHRIQQTTDTVTLRLRPVDATLPPFLPGQFMMLYAFGVGEVAISISGDPNDQDGTLEHTIRAVGPVSRALHDTLLGGVIGVRGPFGTDWGLETTAGRDLIIVAGGLGLAPLRPVVLAAMAAGNHFGRVSLVTGARTPSDMLFRDEQEKWMADGALEVHQTVDRPTAGWRGRVGFVTEPTAHLAVAPDRTTAFLCGPEPMMRFCAETLLRKSVSADDIRMSLERNMQCGTGLCGHCQLGPLLLCRDGPIVDYATADPLLTVREL
ncbi:FAD/NAD(P)-binding protein [Nocardia sp. NBC_01730]|uniref:FAD/NAD(P)-binding protein n=1 Tax=Nocardia sp. NBC_01730 TaxID=2975998 RepID=UPI002E0E7441|nr:FAD/NAD(P)-binding protein [Nocardia sp. NBC_01730]